MDSVPEPLNDNCKPGALGAHFNQRAHEKIHAGIIEEAVRHERLVIDPPERTNAVGSDGT